MLEQIAWDFSDLIEKPAYSGRAPLHFTVDYFTVAEFAEAKAEAATSGGEWPFTGGHRRMWGPSFSNPAITASAHGFILLSTDLRCDCLLTPPYGVNSRACYCPGELMCNAICEPCAWHFIGEEPGAVAAWHDHAWPGWRDLPVIPKAIRPNGGGIDKSTKAALAWVVEHYPPEWQVPGAPMITERDGIGNRHVGGYSPWGGYDISSTALVTS